MKLQRDESDIINVGRNGPKAAMWAAMCADVVAACAALPKGRVITTRELIRDLPWAESRYAAQALYRMRKHGGVPRSCWTPDPNRRWMGNPLILWRCPDDLADVF